MSDSPGTQLAFSRKRCETVTTIRG